MEVEAWRAPRRLVIIYAVHQNHYLRCHWSIPQPRWPIPQCQSEPCGKQERKVASLFAYFSFAFFKTFCLTFQPAEHSELCCEPGHGPATDGYRSRQVEEKLKLRLWEAEEKSRAKEKFRAEEKLRAGERLAKWALQVEKWEWARWFEVGQVEGHGARPEQQSQVSRKLCWMCSLDIVWSSKNCPSCQKVFQIDTSFTRNKLFLSSHAITSLLNNFPMFQVSKFYMNAFNIKDPIFKVWSDNASFLP